MTLEVRVLPRARYQITSIAEWWAQNRSVAQAQRWLDEVDDRLHELGVIVDRLPLAEESNEFEFPLKQLTFGIGRRLTHRLLLSIHNNVVYVHSVRHLAQQSITPEDIEP